MVNCPTSDSVRLYTLRTNSRRALSCTIMSVGGIVAIMAASSRLDEPRNSPIRLRASLCRFEGPSTQSRSGLGLGGFMCVLNEEQWGVYIYSSGARSKKSDQSCFIRFCESIGTTQNSRFRARGGDSTSSSSSSSISSSALSRFCVSSINSTSTLMWYINKSALCWSPGNFLMRRTLNIRC